ncbi:MAG: hypothetical protein M3Z32_12370, partial [Acidobacteriota bacterium]|nr:hypothetical protein [Acidobacteriota bacterium]
MMIKEILALLTARRAIVLGITCLGMGVAIEPAPAQIGASLESSKATYAKVTSVIMTRRKITLSPSRNGIPDTIATDGERVMSLDDAGALVIADVAGGNRRLVFKPESGDSVAGFVPSRDLSIVMLFLETPDGTFKEAAIKSDASGYREILHTDSLATCGDWSWDNLYFLRCESQADDSTQLVRIVVSSGEVKQLLHNNPAIGRAAFSPNGRLIAYSDRLADAARVFVMPALGGEPTPVARNVSFLDWTRDGRFLAIVESRSGSESLYLLPITDGQAAGERVYIQSGYFENGRTTAAGGLAYRSTAPGGNTWLVDLDVQGRLGTWKRLNLSGRGVYASASPGWSADGRQIVYTGAGSPAEPYAWIVRLRDLESGEDREIYRSTHGRVYCAWARESVCLYCAEINGHVTEVLSIEVDSGRMERLAILLDARVLLPHVSQDGRALYMINLTSLASSRWEIGTHQESILQRKVNPAAGTAIPSPDGSLLRRIIGRQIQIRPIAGGDWKGLVYLEATTG